MTNPSAAPAPSPSPAAVKRFALAGPSATPDPAFNAYREDIADIALAGQVIASHYAEPLLRVATCDAAMATGDPIDDDRLAVGQTFAVLDCARGLAWGYRQSDHRVGYVDQNSLADADATD